MNDKKFQEFGDELFGKNWQDDLGLKEPPVKESEEVRKAKADLEKLRTRRQDQESRLEDAVRGFNRRFKRRDAQAKVIEEKELIGIPQLLVWGLAAICGIALAGALNDLFKGK